MLSEGRREGMPANDAGRSQRTEPVNLIKRGANIAYFRSRLAREHPAFLARLEAGEFRSVRAAAKAAGLIHERTRLEELARAWQRANAEDRAAFLATVPRGTPLPNRFHRSTGGVWFERLVMVRQHLLRLKDSGLVENLARSWTPQNRQGYAATLRSVIKDLMGVLAQVESVIEADACLTPAEAETVDLTRQGVQAGRRADTKL
jgi:hypothetical protein